VSDRRGRDGERREAGGVRAGPRSSTTARARVRPRRIPGAPGAVLLRPTRLDVGEDREARRRRRAGAEVRRLPVRAGARGVAAAAGDEASRPHLRLLRTGRDGAAGRTRSRPQRVRAALANLSFDRLVPPDEEARARRSAALRWATTRVAAVAAVALAVYGVFPVRTWIDQRAAEQRARERAEVFQREIELLEQERRDLRTDERIEEEARKMGLVLPGEESFGILPAPQEGPASTTTTAPEG
jgi:hypothetical protein